MATFQPYAAGQKVTAGSLDQLLMIGKVVFSATLAASQTITTGTETTANACAWDTINYDELGAWTAGSPTRWTCPLAGWWTLAGAVSFNGSSGGSQRDAIWFVNGVNITSGRARTYAETSIAAVGLTVEARTIPQLLAVGDYVQLIPVHNIGSSIGTATGTLAPYMAVTYSGPNL